MADKTIYIKENSYIRFRITFTVNGKCQVYHVTKLLLVVECSLLLHKVKGHRSFIQRNCSGQFLAAHFLIREINNLNLKFVVCTTAGNENVKNSLRVRLRVVSHFSSWIVERAKRERARNGGTRRGERNFSFSPRVSHALLSLRKNEGLLVV